MPSIVKAEIAQIEAFFEKPYVLSYDTLRSTTLLLARLITAEGDDGFGEAAVLKPFTDKDVDETEAALKKFLIDHVVRHGDFDVASINQLATEHMPGFDAAKGTVDMAFHELAAKKMGIPLWKLLGEKVHGSFAVLWPLGNGTFAEDKEVIDVKMTEGYRTFMLKMGASGTSIADEIARVKALRKEYGDTIRLIPDANAGWTEDQALEFLEGVKDLNIEFLEQPLAKNDLDGMTRLTAAGLGDISADESLTDENSARNIADRKAASTLSIKISKHGGLQTAKEITDLARERGFRVYFNSMLEEYTQIPSLHLAATVASVDPDLGQAFMSCLRFKNPIVNFADLIANGRVYVPDEPGTGVTVDWDRVRKEAKTFVTIT